MYIYIDIYIYQSHGCYGQSLLCRMFDRRKMDGKESSDFPETKVQRTKETLAWGVGEVK